MPAAPKKGPRFGKDAAHQKALLGNMFASLIAAGYIETTEAKAKMLRPLAEKLITKATKGGLHNHRQVVAFMRDKDMAYKLFDEIGPRYADRPGGYLRILKVGAPVGSGHGCGRKGDKAQMARVEFV